MKPYIEISVIDVISEAVDNIRPFGTITNVINNNNGSYTVSVDNTRNLNDGSVVKIVGTGDFDGKHVVKSKTSLSFNIESSKTLTTLTYGIYQSETPDLHVEKWAGAKNEIYKEALSYVEDVEKFPCILLLLDIKENLTDNIVEISELDLFIFDRCDPTEKINDRRKTSYLSVVEIYQNLMLKLNQSKKLYSKFSHDKFDRFYLGTADKNQNKIGSIVDAMQVTINNLKLINNSKIC